MCGDRSDTCNIFVDNGQSGFQDVCFFILKIHTSKHKYFMKFDKFQKGQTKKDKRQWYGFSKHRVCETIFNDYMPH